jgi:hypothetical protein
MKRIGDFLEYLLSLTGTRTCEQLIYLFLWIFAGYFIGTILLSLI